MGGFLQVRLTGDDRKLAVLQAKAEDIDKMGDLVGNATKAVTQNLYGEGFSSLESPWGEKWEPARYNKGMYPGYDTGELAASLMMREHTYGVMGAIKMRQPKQGGMVQAGAPRPKGWDDPDSQAFDSRGTTRATLPWDFGSKWDAKIETNFDKTIQAWFTF